MAEGQSLIYLPAQYALAWQSTPGGKGAFNFGDTSRYVPGQPRSDDGMGRLIIPGGGGGATTQRRTPGSIFGSAGTTPDLNAYDPGTNRLTPGMSPNGIVLIRLTSIG
jgi:hypothetical protein